MPHGIFEMMNLDTFLKRRKELQVTQALRIRCEKCLQPKNWCYCLEIEPFDCGIKFVILLHPLERRRRIATGRMSHLILKNSEIIHGHTYSNDKRVNEIISNPTYFCVILHLGDNTTQIDKLSYIEKKQFCPEGKKLVIFVVDGTWGTASKSVRNSKNLNALPCISFTPTKVSNFRVRQQPNILCYSTIEAIHATIELFENTQGYNFLNRSHDRLLKTFDHFVSLQVQHLQQIKKNFGSLQYRKKNKR